MRHQHQERSSKRQRGSALVESALVSLSFICMLLMTFDAGFLMFRHQMYTERARAAARWGVTRPYNSSTVAQIQNIVLFDTPAPADSTGTGVFGLVRSNVTVNRIAGATGEPDQLTVRIAGHRYSFLLPLVPGTFAGPRIDASSPMEAP